MGSWSRRRNHSKIRRSKTQNQKKTNKENNVAKTFYECMFLFNANAYARNPAGASNAVEEIIKSVDGEILASRLWNEQKLAYPVGGHRKGAYWLTYFKVESTRVATVGVEKRHNIVSGKTI